MCNSPCKEPIGLNSELMLKSIKSERSPKRQILIGIAAIFALVMLILIVKWKATNDKGGHLPHEPFLITGSVTT
jgi:hypothetical protein